MVGSGFLPSSLSENVRFVVIIKLYEKIVKKFKNSQQIKVIKQIFYLFYLLHPLSASRRTVNT